MNYTFLIPAYNEERNIENVLKACLKVNKKRNIIVVDDGSIDNTGRIAERYGVIVVKNTKNMGKGKAIINGLKLVETEWVVLMDGDAQFNPADIKRFIRLMDKYDMIIGNRFGMSNKLPLHRELANRIIGLIVRTKIKVHDPLCGFRAFKKRDLRPRRYSFVVDLELLHEGYKKGMLIGEVPVPVNYNSGKSTTLKMLKEYLFILGYALGIMIT